MAIKVVFDTNVLVSALINENGKPRKILNLFYDKEILVYYSSEIIEEYKDVLSRKELGINPEKIGKIINAIRKIGLHVQPTKSIFKMPDENDRIFYDAAKEQSKNKLNKLSR